MTLKPYKRRVCFAGYEANEHGLECPPALLAKR